MRDRVHRAPRDKYVRLAITISFSSTICSIATLRPLEPQSQRETVHKGHIGIRETQSSKEKKSVLILIFQICIFLFFVNAFVLFFLSFYSLNSIWFLSATILWQFLLKGRTAVAVKNCFNIKREKFGDFRISMQRFEIIKQQKNQSLHTQSNC